MKLACADAYFCPESVTESVCESCGTVLVYSGRVYVCHEVSCSISVFGNNAVSVVRTVMIDMCYSLVAGMDRQDGGHYM